VDHFLGRRPKGGNRSGQATKRVRYSLKEGKGKREWCRKEFGGLETLHSGRESNPLEKELRQC